MFDYNPMICRAACSCFFFFEKKKKILIAYEDKYFKTKHGQGIAFTVPISSVIGKSIYEFLINMGGNI